MEKKCLIIMPTSNPDGYAQGHFDRVYQYLIAPACKSAGFTPVKADDPSTYYSPLDIVKNLVESDMVICDLSSKTAHALYGLAIRQGVNVPVVVIKDLKTAVTFNLREFDAVEYDESLRIDTVQQETESLSDVLKKAFANKSEVNPLLTRLDLGATQIAEPTYSAPQEEVVQKKEPSLPIISPLPDYVGDPITQTTEIDKLKTGDSLFHMNYGRGEIAAIRKMGKDKIADIQFESGSKTIMLVTSGLFRKVKA